KYYLILKEDLKSGRQGVGFRICRNNRFTAHAPGKPTAMQCENSHIQITERKNRQKGNRSCRGTCTNGHNRANGQIKTKENLDKRKNTHFSLKSPCFVFPLSPTSRTIFRRAYKFRITPAEKAFKNCQPVNHADPHSQSHEKRNHT